MERQSIRQRLRKNELVLGAFLKSADPCMAEILGCSGLDFFVLDNEHVALDKEKITNIIRAGQLYGIAPVIRVMKNEQTNILQALDAGAEGVQVPNIDTPEQAKELQGYAHYQPVGVRGFSPNVRAARYGAEGIHDYIQRSLEETLVVAHIETKEGYENLDGILAVEGIDAIFIGPMDLSQSFGIVGDTKNPILTECVADITARSLAAGKAVGTVCSAAEAGRYAEMGMRYLLIGNDQGAVLNHFKTAVKQVRG